MNISSDSKRFLTLKYKEHERVLLYKIISLRSLKCMVRWKKNLIYDKPSTARTSNQKKLKDEQFSPADISAKTMSFKQLYGVKVSH